MVPLWSLTLSPITQLTLALLVTVPTGGLGLCPDDWLEFNGSCYYGSNSNFSWHGAKQICEEMQWGAHLTSIATEDENTFINGQFGHLQPWIGLNDVDTEGDWKWANGEALVYTNWDAGQPDNTDCDCAYIWKTEGGTWDDTYCNVAFHFVCELTAL